ncbi:SRPBCC family protein [Pseudonocardiaceae bacterium YIM PH 21723]|nr:SRPBCC family protein [Pseudonocardiaceae bacterium YIM PH 21723]
MTEPNATGSVEIAASPEKVYELISDVPNFGKYTAETYRATWLGGPRKPVVGQKFLGWNSNGKMTWATPVKITAADPGRRFAFQCLGVGFEAGYWQYDIEPTDGGCRLTESSWDKRPRWIAKLADTLIRVKDRPADNTRNIAATLERLKLAAES